MSTLDRVMILAGAAAIAAEVVYFLVGGYPLETIAAFVFATAMGVALGLVMSRL
jgi:hypothetical protein